MDLKRKIQMKKKKIEAGSAQRTRNLQEKPSHSEYPPMQWDCFSTLPQKREKAELL